VSFYTALTQDEKNKETAEAIDSFKLRNVVILPLVGCIVLVLLFFFFDILYYLLLALVAFVAYVCLGFVLYPLIEALFIRLEWNEKSLRIPRVPSISIGALTTLLISTSVMVAWVLTSSWVIVNCMAWCIGVTQMTVIRLPSLKVSVCLLAAFLLYDVFWVFLSPYFFGESVMVSVATQMPGVALPMTLSMPHIFNPNLISVLGLGDIVIPGLFVAFNYRFDTYLEESDDVIQPRPKPSYFAIVLIGYAFGYAATLLSFILMQEGQPALLYLVPFTVIPISATAYKRGHLKLMWKGASIKPEDASTEGVALLSMNSDIETGVNSGGKEEDSKPPPPPEPEYEIVVEISGESPLIAK